MLLHTESFDTWVDTTQMMRDYSTVAGTLIPGRNGKGLGMHTVYGVTRLLPGAGRTDVIVGYCNCGAPYAGNLFYVNGADGSSFGIAESTVSGAIKLRLYSDRWTLVDRAISAPGVIQPFVQQYLEFQIKLHPTEGFFRARVDRTVIAEYVGDTMPDYAPYTEIVSTYTGGVSNYAQNGYMDDLYICDLSGDRWNTFRGDIKVLAYPMTGAGAKSEWTSSTANPNWQNIDELGLSDTDYNSTDTVGARDLFTVANTPTAVQVHALRVKGIGMRSDTSPRGVKVGLVSGAAESFSAEKVLSTSWGGMSHIVEVNPATGLPFTPAELALVQPGYELAS